MTPSLTKLCCQALELATQHARRCQHDYVGTEHALLGLLDVPSGHAVSVLRRLNVDVDGVRAEVNGRFSPAGRWVPLGQELPFTPRLNAALAEASEHALAQQRAAAGTEHLLLALLADTQSVAGEVLQAAGLRVEAVQAEVARLPEAEAGETAIQASSALHGVSPGLPALAPSVQAPALPSAARIAGGEEAQPFSAPAVHLRVFLGCIFGLFTALLLVRTSWSIPLGIALGALLATYAHPVVGGLVGSLFGALLGTRYLATAPVFVAGLFNMGTLMGWAVGAFLGAMCCMPGRRLVDDRPPSP
jgi:hypothetical protein